MSGLSTAFILTKLKQYSDASFSRQIKDEVDLQIKMVSATQVLPKALLRPFLYDPLLLPMSGRGAALQGTFRVSPTFRATYVTKGPGPTDHEERCLRGAPCPSGESSPQPR